MEFTNTYEGLDEFAEKTIRIKARRLAAVPGFGSDGVEDMEQELSFHLVKRLPSFDPGKAKWETFVNNVLDNRIKDLLKRHFAASRDALEFQVSLNEPIQSEDAGIERIETVSEADLPWNKIAPSGADYDAVDMRIDLLEAFKKLPSHLQNLFIQLSQDTISDVSRKSGIPRGTLYERIRGLRQHLSEAGLENYF